MNNNPQLTAWNVNKFRFTAFPSLADQEINPDWWMQVMGTEPETMLVKPKTGVTHYELPYEDGNIIFETQLGRVDWLYIPSEDTLQLANEGLTNLGTFEKAINIFLVIVNRWLQLCPKLRRIAFGANVSQPTGGKEDSYKLLATLLPSVKIDPIGSSDFLYQINRPRPSKTGIDSLKINRLTKWAGIVLTVAVGNQEHNLEKTDTKFYTLVEFDINTVTNPLRDIEPNELTNILSELIDLGSEILINGDIP
jgi:hypothetical protein